MNKSLRLSYCLFVVCLMAGCSQEDEKKCEPGCENGIAVSCDENGSRHEMGCPYGCEGDVCKSGEVTPVTCTPLCADGIAVICNEDGSSKEVGCVNGCEGNTCKSGGSEPKVCSAMCADGIAVICNEDGSSKEVGCPFGCEGSVCKSEVVEPDPCVPSCANDIAIVCNEDGTQKEVGCPNGCDGNACRAEAPACVPSCIEGVQVTCNGNEKVEKNCGELGCDGDVCKIEEDSHGKTCIHGVDQTTGECIKLIDSEGDSCDSTFVGECRDGMAIGCVDGSIQATKCFDKACAANGSEAVCYVECPFETDETYTCEYVWSSAHHVCRMFGDKHIYDYKSQISCRHDCDEETGKCVYLSADEGQACDEETFVERCDDNVMVECSSGKIRAEKCEYEHNLCALVNGRASCEKPCDEESQEVYCNSYAEDFTHTTYYSFAESCRYDDNHKLYFSHEETFCGGGCDEETGKCKETSALDGTACRGEYLAICEGDVALECVWDDEKLGTYYTAVDCAMNGEVCVAGNARIESAGCLPRCDNPGDDVALCYSYDSGFRSVGKCVAGSSANYVVFNDMETCNYGCNIYTNECYTEDDPCADVGCGWREVCDRGICLSPESMSVKEGDECTWENMNGNDSFCNGDKRVYCADDGNGYTIHIDDCGAENGCGIVDDGWEKNAYCRSSKHCIDGVEGSNGRGCFYRNASDLTTASTMDYQCRMDTEGKLVPVVESWDSMYCAKGCDENGEKCAKAFEDDGASCRDDYAEHCVDNLSVYCHNGVVSYDICKAGCHAYSINYEDTDHYYSECIPEEGSECEYSISICNENTLVTCQHGKIVYQSCGSQMCLEASMACSATVGDACDDAFTPYCVDNKSYHCDSNTHKVVSEVCDYDCNVYAGVCETDLCENVTCSDDTYCYLGICISYDAYGGYASCDPATFIDACSDYYMAYYCDRETNTIQYDYCAAGGCHILKESKKAVCSIPDRDCKSEGQTFSYCSKYYGRRGTQLSYVCHMTTSGYFIVENIKKNCDDQGCNEDNTACIAYR